MKEKDTARTPGFLEKTDREKQEEFVDVFKYFENANKRNHDAFCELLDYTKENRRGKQ
ncbi:MAG: hypothetical protein ACM3ZR_03850 [Pseudomonadota bacterium]